MIHSVNNCVYQLCSEGNSTAGGVGKYKTSALGPYLGVSVRQ